MCVPNVFLLRPDRQRILTASGVGGMMGAVVLSQQAPLIAQREFTLIATV